MQTEAVIHVTERGTPASANERRQVKKWGLTDKALLGTAIVGVCFLGAVGLVQLNKTLLGAKTEIPAERLSTERDDSAALGMANLYMLKCVTLVMDTRDYARTIGLSESAATRFVVEYPEFVVKSYGGSSDPTEYSIYTTEVEASWKAYFKAYCRAFDEYAKELSDLTPSAGG